MLVGLGSALERAIHERLRFRMSDLSRVYRTPELGR
jgi:hypothetical protein